MFTSANPNSVLCWLDIPSLAGVVLARFPAATDGFAEQMDQAVIGCNVILQVRDGDCTGVLEISVRHFHTAGDGGEGGVHL